MATKQGKVKAVGVEIFEENLQVVYKNKIETVESFNHTLVKLKGIDKPIFKDEVKTLVVEYETKEKINRSVPSVRDPRVFEVIQYPKQEQLPLKYSQWQSAIDNGEVDSGKLVEFQDKLLDFTYGANEYAVEVITSAQCIAKIIPKKKKTYTHKEVISMILRINEHAVGVFFEKDIYMDINDMDDLNQDLNDWALKNVLK